MNCNPRSKRDKDKEEKARKRPYRSRTDFAGALDININQRVYSIPAKPYFIIERKGLGDMEIFRAKLASLEFAGFRFCPSDDQLVGYYLQRRINGTLRPEDFLLVKDCDLYGEEEPWEIWNRFKKESLVNLEGDLYFFTKLKKLASNFRNFIRKVGLSSKASWHGEDGNGSEIQIDKLMAVKKRFIYWHVGSSQHKCWIMHEYKLGFSDIVVCRLRRTKFSAEAARFSSKKRRLPMVIGESLVADSGGQFLEPKRRCRFEQGPLFSDQGSEFTGNINGGMMEPNTQKAIEEESVDAHLPIDYQCMMSCTSQGMNADHVCTVMNEVEERSLPMMIMVQGQVEAAVLPTSEDNNEGSTRDYHENHYFSVDELLGESNGPNIQNTIAEICMEQAGGEVQALYPAAVPSSDVNHLLSTAEYFPPTGDGCFNGDNVCSGPAYRKKLLDCSDKEEDCVSFSDFEMPDIDFSEIWDVEYNSNGGDQEEAAKQMTGGMQNSSLSASSEQHTIGVQALSYAAAPTCCRCKSSCSSEGST